jgi:SagB-type dehydrogenase family enzyme
MIFRSRRMLGPDAEPTRETLSELFHENTKLHPRVPGAFTGNNFDEAETGAMVSVGRRYARLPRVGLAATTAMDEAPSLHSAIERRRSRRSFADSPIAFSTLSELLRLTNGVTETQRLPGGQTRELRAAPSAGALYPIEIYLGVRRVADVPPGLYHYEPRGSSITRLTAGDPLGGLLGACYYHDSLRQAALVVVLAGVLERTKRKYGERGYRYVLIEAGHVAQNLCLAASALDLGCMPVCGFYDDALNDLLALDGVEESALYVAYLGMPAAGGEARP